MLLDNLITFLECNFDKYKNEHDWLAKQIIKGIRNGTCDYISKNGEIIACVRFNIINDGRVADILDFAVKENNDGIGIMKYFIARAWLQFPCLIYVRFNRMIKYPDREHRIYELTRFL